MCDILYLYVPLFPSCCVRPTCSLDVGEAGSSLSLVLTVATVLAVVGTPYPDVEVFTFEDKLGFSTAGSKLASHSLYIHVRRFLYGDS